MRLIRTWRMARYMVRKADEGCRVIAVPAWMAADIQRQVWHRKMIRAVAKWDQRVAEVPLSAWQSATRVQRS